MTPGTGCLLEEPQADRVVNWDRQRSKAGGLNFETQVARQRVEGETKAKGPFREASLAQ